MMTKASKISKKRSVPLKLILILVAAEVFELIVAAIGWNWYPSMPLALKFAMSIAFCLAAWLIARPFLNKISATHKSAVENNV